MITEPSPDYPWLTEAVQSEDSIVRDTMLLPDTF